MSLPKILATYQTVTIDGEDFEVRALTGAEAARANKIVSDKKPLEALELFVIAAGTDTAPDETKAWYEATPRGAVDELLRAIKELSRIDEEAQKSG